MESFEFGGPAVCTIMSLRAKTKGCLSQFLRGTLANCLDSEEINRTQESAMLAGTAAIATTLANPPHREQQATSKSLGPEPREGTLRQGLHKS